MNRLARSFQSVAVIASAMTIAMMIEATAAAADWVWKTSTRGASFVCVSMIANRISTLIAPMYTITCAAPRSGAPRST